MPPRTNEFQELVSLIRKALARDGDTVEDSAMVRVHGLATEREIDILHKTSDGFTTIKIAVEAKDEDRKIDVLTLEQLCAKYRGEGRVCVDKFMIVSRHGFTQGAIEKAALLDVPLLTLDEAKHLDWTKVGIPQTDLRRAQSLAINIAPHFREIRVEPKLPAGLERGIIKDGVVRCSKCRPNGGHGTVFQYARRVTLERRDPQGLAALKQMADRLRTDPRGVLMKTGVKIPDGYVIRHLGTDYPFHEMHVAIHAQSGKGELKRTTYEMSSTEGHSQVVHHLSAEIGGTTYQFVIPDGEKSKKIVMKIGQTSARERAEKRKKTQKAAKAAIKKQRKKP